MEQGYLGWPFFEARHRDFAAGLRGWASENLPSLAPDPQETDAICRDLVARLGAGGWLQPTAADAGEALDLRKLCLAREILAYHDGLADFSFAMQGLGMGAVSLFGSPSQREWLPLTRSGRAIAGFALTEPDSGSDVAAISTLAVQDDAGWVLDGCKTYISNGGIADVYVVFARTGDGEGARGLSAFLVPADSAGLTVEERIDVMAPHPLATLRFQGLRLPASALVGEKGQGFRIAMGVLDMFRSTVGAAALGFARRALSEAMAQVLQDKPRGGRLADHQIVQGHLADMALKIDAAALLVYRAAWTKDQGAGRITREAAMAKLYATEAASEVIDMSLQLHGGDGVRCGNIIERLYREIRALRIYEGASDVQRVIISRAVIAGYEDSL